MSFDRLPPPLRIAVDRNRLRRCATAVHAGAALCVSGLPLGWDVRLLLLVGCAISAYYVFRTSTGLPAVQLLDLDATGRWRLFDGRRRWLSARLVTGQRLPGLLWLEWRGPVGRRQGVLIGGSGPVRRLRARLRLEGYTGDEPSG